MNPEYENLEYTSHRGLGCIYLNRPEKKNALNELMLTEFYDCLVKAETDKNLRMLVIRGKGTIFCGGADLQWFFTGQESGMKELIRQAELFYDCYEKLYRFPLPTIALVHGAVFGGANGLLAACDFGLAHTGTRFSFSEVRLGLVPATISPFVISKTGVQKARELLLTGSVISEKEAVDCRLINYYGKAEEMETRLEKISEDVKQSAPGAVTQTKKLIQSAESMYFGPDIRGETCRLLAQVRSSDEAKKGLRAFMEKRLPDW